MSIFGTETIEEKVKAKLVYDALKEDQKGGGKSLDDGLQKMLNKVMWKEAEAIWKGKCAEASKKVADRMMQTFEEWNKTKRKMVQEKKTPEEISKAKDDMKSQESLDITDIINGYNSDIDTYMKKAMELKPKLGEKLTYDGLVQTILTQAQDDFQKRVKAQMELAKALAKLKALTQLAQFDIDKLNQKLSDLPLMIEEKIDKVKTTLDTLLGKLTLPMYQPNLPEFDVNALIALIKSFLNPVISATMPLTAVLGKIPILGDIIGLLAVLQSGSGAATSLSKEDIMKLVPKKPELDPTLLDKLKAIGDDVMMFCMTLPTLLIQVIFAMIDAIYSKLKIITSIIPLGGMFPLNLVPAAITATPKILSLIKVLPGMMLDLAKGIIMDKLQEAMALAFPIPNIDMESLTALADDINEQDAPNKSVADKKRSYDDVTKEIFESQLKPLGYSQIQAKTVQKNYIKIYNGSESLPPVEITEFEDNGKEQVLPSIGVSLVDVATLGATNNSGAQEEPGFKENKVKRTPPSVEDYESYFNALIGESDLKTSLNYQKMKKTKDVVGELYDSHKEQFKKYGHDVVLKDKLEPPQAKILGILPL